MINKLGVVTIEEDGMNFKRTICVAEEQWRRHLYERGRKFNGKADSM